IFFFQADDGIRDRNVTGVQTCALPILAMAVRGDGRLAAFTALAKFSPILAVRDVRRVIPVLVVALLVTIPFWSWWVDWARLLVRSEESRVGKECGFWWWW